MKQSFLYALDKVSNITKTTHNDGSYWDYVYDDRYRLVTAVRNNKTTPTISARYYYTYDDGDNLLTKVEPFNDDFNDGDTTGWSGGVADWSASTGVMKTTTLSGTRNIQKSSFTDADNELRFSYMADTSNGGSQDLVVLPRFVDSNNRLRVTVKAGELVLSQSVSGTDTTLDTNTAADTDEDVWYEMRIVCDGANVTVWRGVRGEAMEEVLSTSSASHLTSSTLLIQMASGDDYHLDNFVAITDAYSSTTTHNYNNGNELTSMVFEGDTTTFTYDDWGRQISKYMGSQGTTMAYAYGSKLTEFSSTFYDEGDVDYAYRGDGKRHKRTAGSDVTVYNWAAGFVSVSEENSGGTLQRSYVCDDPRAQTARTLAHVDGTTPGSGVYLHYMHDHLGSTRFLYDGSKNLDGELEYTPYGGGYLTSAAADVTRAAISRKFS